MKEILKIKPKEGNERKLFASSLLENRNFQLLPFRQIVPAVMEKTLKWQSEFTKHSLTFPKVLIIAIYNGGDLREFIESLAVQSYQGFELVIIASKESSSGLSFLKDIEAVPFSISVLEGRKEKIDETVQNFKKDASFVLLSNTSVIFHPTALFTFTKETVQADFKRELGENLNLNNKKFIISNEIKNSGGKNSYIRRSGELNTIGLLHANLLGECALIEIDYFLEVFDLIKNSFKEVEDKINLANVIQLLGFLASTGSVKSSRIPLALYHGVSPIENKSLSKFIKSDKLDEILNFSFSTEFKHLAKSSYPLNSNIDSVGVVIPFKDQADMTIECVKSLLHQKTSSSLNIILVSNNSSSNSVSQVKEFISSIEEGEDSVELLENNAYFNYAMLCNHGADYLLMKYECESLLFLNNDVVISDINSLELLLKWLSITSVGAVGGLLSFPDGSIQSAGINLSSHGPLNVTLENQFAQVTRCVDALTFAYCVVKAKAWEEVDRLDEFYCPNGFGDALIGKLLSNNGWDLVLASEAKATHFESKSRKESLEHLELWELEKNGILIARHYDEFSNKKSTEIVNLSGVQAGGRKLLKIASKLKRLIN